MTTEEAGKVLITHGFKCAPWRTEDEVWMAAWRWGNIQEWWEEFEQKLLKKYHPITIFVGSPDFLVELATFLEGRCEKS